MKNHKIIWTIFEWIMETFWSCPSSSVRKTNSYICLGKYNFCHFYQILVSPISGRSICILFGFYIPHAGMITIYLEELLPKTRDFPHSLILNSETITWWKWPWPHHLEAALSSAPGSRKFLRADEHPLIPLAANRTFPLTGSTKVTNRSSSGSNENGDLNFQGKKCVAAVISSGRQQTIKQNSTCMDW